MAWCLLGDPELLIVDMIASLVGEGRTVLLSSHQLDEVGRTCDGVAIVNHGRVIRQGPIDELVRGAGNRILRDDCADPAAAGRLVEEAGMAAGVALGEQGLTVTLPAGVPRETVAEVNRRLVAGGISVYGLQEVQATLEASRSWSGSASAPSSASAPCPSSS